MLQSVSEKSVYFKQRELGVTGNFFLRQSVTCLYLHISVVDPDDQWVDEVGAVGQS